MHLITDTRKVKDMKKTTFNQYKRQDVFKFLHTQIKNQNLDTANYWAGELLISGAILNLFEKLLEVFCVDINIKNPQFIFYLWQEYDYMLELTSEYDDLVEMRNNMEIRNIVSNLVNILVFSEQYSLPKMEKIASYELKTLSIIRLQYNKNTENIQPFLKPGDPRSDIEIPLNEIVNHLKTPKLSNSLENIVYWVSWLLAWENELIKVNSVGGCSSRDVPKLDKVYHTDVIWIVWNVILSVSETKKDSQIKKICQKCRDFYVYFYNKSNKSKKLYLLIFSATLFIRSISYDTNIYGDIETYGKNILAQANIDTLYKHLDNIKDSTNTEQVTNNI
jgi:hypothetical protein